ncbi:nucleoporin-interacting protein NIC96 [Peniophora sp. CONT]|nr:nucleoporin-interacting protein NIC96 [Peniophora sp. CONT]
MSTDLAALLAQSKALNAQFARPELPHVQLSLDQIEAQSRRLVSQQPGTQHDQARANYLLAQARVDAPALAASIAGLNAQNTFAPLQPLPDNDVAGFLRHAHEQSIIGTIESARKETQDEFAAQLERRAASDWAARKARVFEELGGARAGSTSKAVATRSSAGSVGKSVGPLSAATQAKMMAYDRPIAELNAARLKGQSYPIIHELARVSMSLNPDHTNQTTQTLHILSKIAREPPSLPSPSHPGASTTPNLLRRWSRPYLSDALSPDSISLRRQIATGAREALEEQYAQVLERAVHARLLDARLGGDPSASNKVRAFLLVRFYRNGEWTERIELVAAQPLWAKLFFLVRIGAIQDALSEAQLNAQALDAREAGFTSSFRAYLEDPSRRLNKTQRDAVQSAHNAHMLHAAAADPFKLALYKLMGRLEPTRRSVPLVTSTTEDWLWFQLAMSDEDDPSTSIRALGDTLLGYGPSHFASRPGAWAGALMSAGMFERAVAALLEREESYVEGVHIAVALAYHGLLRVAGRAETSDVSPLSTPPNAPPALSLAPVLWRYVRPFVKTDAKEALQYVYALPLCADQPGPAGQEQLELAYELVRKVIVGAGSGPAWDELVGGFRSDGTQFPGAITHSLPLLALTPSTFSTQILSRAASTSQSSARILEAVKLYNLAGDHTTVVSCLSSSLGAGLTSSSEEARELEKVAREIVRSYERTGRAVGKERDCVWALLGVREALELRAEGRFEAALETLERTHLLPTEPDMARLARRAEAFRDAHEALARAASVYVPLAMDCLGAIYRRTKGAGGGVGDAGRAATLAGIRTKAKALTSFAGMIRYRLPSETHAHLQRLNVEMGV